jgi:hypothetical protein
MYQVLQPRQHRDSDAGGLRPAAHARRLHQQSPAGYVADVPLSRRKLSRVALAALVSTSSCALWAAREPSPQSNCQKDTSAGAFDLLIATTAATLLRATKTFDTQPVWALLPATFLISGGLGVFYAYRCQDRESDPTPAPNSLDVMPDAAPDAAPNPPSDAAPNPLSDAAPNSPRDAASNPPSDAALPLPPLPCSISPTVVCPDHFSCALIDGNRGTCTADH